MYQYANWCHFFDTPRYSVFHILNLPVWIFSGIIPSYIAIVYSIAR